MCIYFLLHPLAGISLLFSAKFRSLHPNSHSRFHRGVDRAIQICFCAAFSIVGVTFEGVNATYVLIDHVIARHTLADFCPHDPGVVIIHNMSNPRQAERKGGGEKKTHKQWTEKQKRKEKKKERETTASQWYHLGIVVVLGHHEA